MIKCAVIENDDITVIMRSVGERTEFHCKRILCEIFGKDNVFCVRNISPFSAALDKAYEIGIKANKKYTLMVDADVLLDKERTIEFINTVDAIQNHEGPFFTTEVYVYDRFRRRPVLAGINLYLTELLNNARVYTKNGSIRPETTTIKGVANDGYHSIYVPMVIGIHDFFQYYRSIVKKAMVFSKKHPEFQHWKECPEKPDREQYYLLEGLKLGRQCDKIVVDDRYLDELINNSGLDFDDQERLSQEEVEKKLNELSNRFIYTVFTKSEIKPRGDMLKNALLQFRVFAVLKSLKDKMKPEKG